MNVTLPPEFETLVQQKVASGKYRSADEVLTEGLRLLQEREQMGRPDFMVANRHELEAKLLEGVEELDRGERIPAEVSYERVIKQLRKPGG
ncbi:MAG: type II toxin-antitoxin system ParD family antitoxin [Verrucomicrobia bacterium]|nr:type II toxin-antitoxin system ParD family antitoxin [Verrucomicrobiota bacterium]